ncbi:MAG: sn-glycerol-3-phosphate import ATP-binding protein UgpC [Rhodospirillales bacterium]
MASVSLQGVKKSYGKTPVIHGVDVEIEDGAFVVIVGPSGCGKSTLLRMVAGLEAITEGQISIGSRVVNDLEPKDRDVAMVFQNYALYPHMSVRQNMGYGLKLAGVPKPEIATRVQQAADLLQLQGLLDRRPRQMSGGQRQRVAMGRAIVRDPAVFLFDEPLSNLDAKLRVQMRLEIKRLQRRLATTALYVTHDQVEAMTLGDRLIVMNDGVAEQIASPLEIYERPASLFVAGFIGSPAMNFLDATVEGAGLRLSGGAFVAAEHSPAEGRSVTLGLRPEHLHFDAEAPAFSLAVEMVETLGADTLAYGRIGGEGTALTLRLPGSRAVTAGETLPLAVAPQALHLFDPETGQRL